MYRSFTPKRVIPGIKYYAKVPIYPTDEQVTILNQSLAFHKSLWQLALDYERRHYRETGKHTSYVALSRWWTVMRQENPAYRVCPTNSCEYTLRILSTEMARYYHKIATSRAHVRMRSASTVNFFTHRSGCRVIDNRVFTPEISDGVLFAPVEFLGLLKSVRFIRTRLRWYVLFTMLVPPATYEIRPIDRKQALPVYSSGIGDNDESRGNPRISEPRKRQALPRVGNTTPRLRS